MTSPHRSRLCRHGLLASAAAAGVLVACAAVPVAPARAQPSAAGETLPQERALPLALAVEIARAAVETCGRQGAAVAATVVDRSGVLRVALRADRAGPHTAEESRAKAYTALSLRNSTGALAAALDGGGAPGRAGRALAGLPGFLLHGGGVPIVAGDEVIGGLGVGGSGSGEADEACAEAALRSVRDRLR